MKYWLIGFVFVIASFPLRAQFKADRTKWSVSGTAIYEQRNNAIVKVQMESRQETILLATPAIKKSGFSSSGIADFHVSPDEKSILIFTNTAKVWRYDTRGDYWLYTVDSGTFRRIGAGKPSQQLMYAKLSPDGQKVAYVYKRALYCENVRTGKTDLLTPTDQMLKVIHGTFDWVYEEEFGCRDGFRWSADSRQIAFWQVDARNTPDFYMINNTDSVYAQIAPVEYPKAGETPSAVRIGVVSIETAQTVWMNIPGDSRNHYLPRMEWSGAQELIVQQLNRKQNESRLYFCNTVTGTAQEFYKETDPCWIDIKARWNDDDPAGWEFFNGNRSFLWVSEQDGWRHIYKIDRKGNATLLTIGNYDIETISGINESTNEVYFIASPDQPIQRYLYKVKMDGKSKAVRVTPKVFKGTNTYELSPGAGWAVHSFTNRFLPTGSQIIQLPNHESVTEDDLSKSVKQEPPGNLEFFTITTDDGITMDGWISKPRNYDSSKKYPVVLYVYGEPGRATVEDVYGCDYNYLFNGDFTGSGYFYVSFNNRGTPTLKGAQWRRAIYRQIGRVNIRDQAMAMKKLLQQKSFLDPARVAVWGWSGGGSSTLHLLFQYPDLFQTGIAIAPLTNQLFYDNIYQERYMGLPQENRTDFINGSPVTYAKNLKGKLLLVHGTGDDNVHYSNSELLVQELIRYGKLFTFMPYPNCTHNLREGPGSFAHLKKLYTTFLVSNCPPGAK
jgi:dipeptidyl-peptidase-4